MEDADDAVLVALTWPLGPRIRMVTVGCSTQSAPRFVLVAVTRTDVPCGYCWWSVFSVSRVGSWEHGGGPAPTGVPVGVGTRVGAGVGATVGGAIGAAVGAGVEGASVAVGAVGAVVAEADGEVLGLAVCSPSTAPGGVEGVGCRAEGGGARLPPPRHCREQRDEEDGPALAGQSRATCLRHFASVAAPHHIARLAEAPHHSLRGWSRSPVGSFSSPWYPLQGSSL